VNSSKIRLLAIAALLVSSVATAYACGDEDKKTSSNASASVASAEKADGCCASKASKSSNAVAKSASGCESKGASASLASVTKGAGGDHCAKNKTSALASGECTYGEKSVTLAGACPAKNEADYSFFVAGAECKGTGSEVARAVKATKGVSSVTVDYANHMVYVCADGKTASKKAIQNSLKKAGYEDVKFVSQARENCQKSHGKVEA
jgi:copper chaperone CopZ